MKTECLHGKTPNRWYNTYSVYAQCIKIGDGSCWPSFKDHIIKLVPALPGTPQNTILVDGDGIAAFDFAASPVPIDFDNADCSYNHLTLNESENKMNIIWMPFETP